MTSGKTEANRSVRNLQDYFLRERRGGSRKQSGWNHNSRPEVKRLRHALQDAGFLAAAMSEDLDYLSEAHAAVAVASWKNFPSCLAAYPMQLSKRSVHGIRLLPRLPAPGKE